MQKKLFVLSKNIKKEGGRTFRSYFTRIKQDGNEKNIGVKINNNIPSSMLKKTFIAYVNEEDIYYFLDDKYPHIYLNKINEIVDYGLTQKKPTIEFLVDEKETAEQTYKE